MADVSNKFERKYYPGIDTLRGLAILMILIYHYFNILPLAIFGSLGVDLFFVLSGFLITDLLLRSKGNQGFLKNFYIRRILRIFPIYFSTLLLLILILPAICHVPYDVQYYRGNQYWFYMFIQNYLFILKPLEKTRLLNHFWSLATEEQFYLLWPVVIFFTQKITKLAYVLFCIFVLVFLARLSMLYWYTTDNLFYIFSRFDGLLVGSTIAIYIIKGYTITKRQSACILISIALINLSFYLAVNIFKKEIPYFPFCGYSTFSILFGLLVYFVIVNKNSSKSTSLFQKMLQFFGKISYGLYVYHWPVFVFLFPAVRNNLSILFFNLSYTVTFLFAAIITTMVSILLSILSYRYFEKSFLLLKKRYPQ